LFNASNGAIFPAPVIAATSESFTLTADDGDAEVGGTGSFSEEGGDYGQVVGGTVTSSNADAVGSQWWQFPGFSYFGTETFTIVANVNQYTDLGSFSGSQQQIDPLNANGSVTITWDYNGPGPFGPAIPEPSTLILLTMGAVVSVRRFRRQHRRP
jgi:hypothetical protein